MKIAHSTTVFRILPLDFLWLFRCVGSTAWRKPPQPTHLCCSVSHAMLRPIWFPHCFCLEGRELEIQLLTAQTELNPSGHVCRARHNVALRGGIKSWHLPSSSTSWSWGLRCISMEFLISCCCCVWAYSVAGKHVWFNIFLIRFLPAIFNRLFTSVIQREHGSQCKGGFQLRRPEVGQFADASWRGLGGILACMNLWFPSELCTSNKKIRQSDYLIYLFLWKGCCSHSAVCWPSVCACSENFFSGMLSNIFEWRI